MSTQHASVVRRIAVVGGGWVLLAGLTIIALVRTFRSETEPLLIGLQAVAVWLLLPSYAVLAAALWRRNLAMAGVAAVLCCGQLLWTIPAIGWHGNQSLPAGAVPFRLVTANLELDNAQTGEFAAALAYSGADVVLLQEVTPEIAASLEGSPLDTRYPQQIFDALPGYHGSAIYSRLPVIAGRAFDIGGYPMTRADVQTAAGPVRVVNVHVVAPINDSNVPYWRSQLDLLSRLEAPTGSRLILAGDFNATVDHAPFGRLLDSGYRDAFLEAGCGYGATWPNWAGPIFPVMRLDHVLVPASIGVLAVAEHDTAGSDHRRLVVDLALPAGL